MSPPKEPYGEGPDDLTVEEIRSALRDVAQEYEPSRAAIERRVARGRAAGHSKRSRASAGQHAPRAFFTMRPVGAALAVVVISVLSVVAVRSGNKEVPVAEPPFAAPVAGSPSWTPSPSPSLSPSSRAGTSSSQQTRTPTSPSSTAGSASAAGQPSPNGILTADGAVDPHSVDTWSQTNVTIANTAAVSSLLITIKIALTPNASEAGKFSTVPNSDLTMTVTRDAKNMIYTYELRNGATLNPGTYLFAAQFLHGSGRGAAQDSYTVVARAGNAHATLDGTFG
jgi:hypothetical protein